MITPSVITEAIIVNVASVVDMIKKLVEKKLIRYDCYFSVTLHPNYRFYHSYHS